MKGYLFSEGYLFTGLYGNLCSIDRLSSKAIMVATLLKSIVDLSQPVNTISRSRNSLNEGGVVKSEQR